MSLNETDKQRLAGFYGQAIADHGVHSPRALHWISTENQLTRFKLLADVGDLSQVNVLDVGSGLGDFYPYLKQRFGNSNYTGIDILPDMVSQARLKYPTGKFWVVDPYDITEYFDFILASGAFSFNIAEGRPFYYRLITQLYKMTRKAFAFNMLDIDFEATDEHFLSYDKQEVAKFCQQLTPNYTITTGYELGDFTVFLQK